MVFLTSPMDFDAQGVYADLDGVIHFLRLLEGIWIKVEIVKLCSKSYCVGLDVVQLVWAFALTSRVRVQLVYLSYKDSYVLPLIYTPCSRTSDGLSSRACNTPPHSDCAFVRPWFSPARVST